MSDLIRKRIVLCLLDSIPKFADAIANEIDESLSTVGDLLTTLVSGGICEEINQDESRQYALRKDVAIFVKLVKEFLSNPEEHNKETEQFISSEFYLNRIDYDLVEYILNRFRLDSVYSTDEAKEVLRRILRVSPSALTFALHGDTTFFHGMWSSRNQLDSSNETRDWINGILYSQFQIPLLQNLIVDMKVPIYAILFAKHHLQIAKTTIQVDLATPHGVYVESMGGSISCLNRAMEELQAGQPTSPVNLMAFSNDGLALMHLREFQTAIENFDTAFNAVQDPIQKATVLNNKGIAFLRMMQYQKAARCFEEGIAFDLDGVLPVLRQNKQVAEEYLARATDADRLTEPTQIRFFWAQPVPFEETLRYEFKEIRGGNPVGRIEDNCDEYAVAFLNRQGGRIFWGVRNEDRITIGVELDERQRDEIRSKVSNKLGAIRPPISPEHWQLEFHNVYNLKDGDIQGEIVEDLWVIELVVPPQERNVFYTGGGSLYVKTDGGKKKLIAEEVTEFIRRYVQNEAEKDRVD